MTELEALWQQMEMKSGERSNGLLRRRLTAERDDGLFVGLDPASRERLFLVDLPQDEDFSVRNLPRWAEVRVERIVLEHRPQRVRVKVTLVNPRFADVFTAFANDLYRTLRSIESQPAIPTALTDRLEKWNRFFREHGPEGLGEEDQRGLYGELFFLGRHVLPRLPTIDGIRTWMGPGGADHDFRLPNGCVEAKTIGARPPRTLHIANERQLDNGDCARLYLYWQMLEKTDAGENLPVLVEDIRRKLESDRFAAEAFEQKLLMAGYLDLHAPMYATRYRVSDEALCHVREGFPRIVHLAEGILAVRYEVAPEQCRPFQVDLARTIATLTEPEAGA